MLRHVQFRQHLSPRTLQEHSLKHTAAFFAEFSAIIARSKPVLCSHSWQRHLVRKPLEKNFIQALAAALRVGLRLIGESKSLKKKGQESKHARWSAQRFPCQQTPATARRQRFFHEGVYDLVNVVCQALRPPLGLQSKFCFRISFGKNGY